MQNDLDFFEFLDFITKCNEKDIKNMVEFCKKADMTILQFYKILKKFHHDFSKKLDKRIANAFIKIY